MIRKKQKITKSKLGDNPDEFQGIRYKGQPYDFAVKSLGVFGETNRLRYGLGMPHSKPSPRSV